VIGKQRSERKRQKRRRRASSTAQPQPHSKRTHLAPHHSELGAGGSLGGLVDVGDLLAAVELGRLLVLDVVEGDQRGVVVCVAAASVDCRVFVRGIRISFLVIVGYIVLMFFLHQELQLQEAVLRVG
jgi:hypothetical protein